MTIEQKLSYYINKASELTGRTFGKKIRIGILCSFTINGLEEAMRVKSAEKNIDCITYVGGYNQYNQEILNHESNVYKFSPDLTFLIVDTRNILGNLFHFPYSISASERRSFVEKKVKEIQNLANAFTSKTKSKLVIANFPLPTYSPHGIFETKTEYGLHKMIEDLNSRLIDSFANSDSIYIYDFNGFVSQYGEDNIFDYKQFLFGDMKISLDYIPYLANDLIGYVVGHLGLSKKCIILDLDNTLWGGIVGEDGFNGIRLGPEPPGNSYLEFQRVLLSLYQRGIILAINSKNNYDEALKVIKEHPYMVLREEHFASIRINWNDKVSNMKEIANGLNIGADSMVFFDDDPVNREYMRINMPQILTVDLPQDPSQYAQTIKKMNEFSVLSITDEDAQRGKMYLEQRKRSDLEQSAPDLESFLKNLDLKVLIKNANEFTIPRISQLTLKTNQFNLTTKRYQESDIKKLSEDDRYVVGCAQVTDKFGDNGITGVFIVRKENPKEWFIDTFLLSSQSHGKRSGKRNPRIHHK
ncbi:HAD-IIIC family phosphatase [Candidatus Nitrosotenuis chungbukensis]|uniref:HAD-IIIC family phosphatase n=1 Tax=Candidatus Nitrosotenuis chungbukensis TaxID=1353246 RepID=UPI002673F55E|nr:HAD-IIIC family phosphatase [Candidatus Nitrosotenuis chungbukensis]WKT58313.1 HAD-IIIC family phosphatase [Candidatus Nitrosotenuis chungbukensis]